MKTPAERQAAYRARRKAHGDRAVLLYLTADAVERLARLSNAYGTTQSNLVENLLSLVEKQHLGETRAALSKALLSNGRHSVGFVGIRLG